MSDGTTTPVDPDPRSYYRESIPLIHLVSVSYGAKLRQNEEIKPMPISLNPEPTRGPEH
jgi:hypothetical protein